MKRESVLFEYVRKNKFEYIIVTVLMIIGIICGVFFINSSNNERITAISSSVTNIQELIKNEVYVNKGALLVSSLKQNILLVLIIWFIGCTIIGMPILCAIILYKGFCIGYTISAIIATLEYRKAIIFIVLSLLPQNIIIIPSILLISVSRNKTI